MSAYKSRTGDYQSDEEIPDEMYVARFGGFSVRDDETKMPILKQRTVQNEIKDYVYWRFEVASGEHEGAKVPASCPWKGIDLAIDPETQGEFIRLGVSGERRPNLMDWAEKSGVDWETLDADMARLGVTVDPPFTPSKMLHALEAIMADKADRGHLVMISVRGNWVHWEGGLASLPPDIREMMKATSGEAVPSIAAKPPEFKRVQDYANEIFTLSHNKRQALGLEVLPTKSEIARWMGEQFGVPVGAGMTDLLNIDQLYQAIGYVTQKLDGAEVTYAVLDVGPIQPAEIDEDVPL